MMLEFTVGINIAGKHESVTVAAEDALIAALKVKCERPDAVINYVRRRNKRGDLRLWMFIYVSWSSRAVTSAASAPATDLVGSRLNMLVMNAGLYEDASVRSNFDDPVGIAQARQPVRD